MQSSITSSERPRVLVVDDNEAILTRVAAVLTPSCVVVGAARDGRSAIEAAGKLQPEVIVLDISMPGMTGLEVARRLRAAGSRAAIVFLTVLEEDDIVAAARSAGALGYVVKPRLISDLLQAVREARAGREFVSLSPGVTRA